MRAPATSASIDNDSEFRSIPPKRKTMPDSAAPLLSFDHEGLYPANTALFLDFDGTLAEIVDDPEAVTIHPGLRDLLAGLEVGTAGALAIVTGRAIRDIDRFLAPLTLPVAGVHGLERRTASGEMMTGSFNEATLDIVRCRLEAALEELPGTAIESKPGSLALHYRRHPELAKQAMEAVHRAVDGLEGMDILHGKMVVEVKTGNATKADAVAAFMREDPFAGRIPLFAGDDVTDEHAFGEVARLGGVSIKIGAGQTAATFRARDTAELRTWLTGLAESFAARQLAG